MALQHWQGVRIDEKFDAARHAGLAPDEAGAFECQHHLMDGWRGDAEMALQVGLGGRPAENLRIGVDEGQILALLWREARSGYGRHSPGV